MTEENLQNTFPEAGEIYLIDKELNWTSFNVVKKMKILLLNKHKIKKLKIGHAGTLDPLATGLVIVCSGRQTKSIEQYQAAEKEYIATVKLGATTPSFDLETEVDKEYPVVHITEEKLLSTLKSFESEQDQVPPVFSAKNINGKRAYEYARKGIKVIMKSSRIEFYSIELLNFELPYFTAKIVCSKGTYIRSFARDIGEAMESGAHLTALRRTRIGKYKVGDALDIKEFENEILGT